jgi:uncharacterized protein YjbK
VSQEIEIEFKNMLTKEEYQSLLNTFSIKESEIITQINYYLDTSDLSLMKNKCALRVREKNGKFKLTLKQPVSEGLLETNQVISASTFAEIKKKGLLPEGEVKDVLYRAGINTKTVCLLGTLQTNRVSFPYKDGVLFLDHSSYFNKEDYELEYEVTNREAGNTVFLELLNFYHIPKRNTDNKISRFFKEKKKQHPKN